MTSLRLLVASLGLAAISAAPALDLEDLLRQGNAAFSRGDYATAVELFEKTEDLTGDPGQTAFNKGTALYRLALQPDRAKTRGGLLQEAEKSFRRSLEDADGARRRLAWFGLGNSLLQQHPGRGPKVLFDAVACYEKVLADADAPADLRDDARHNLELARLLWAEERGSNDNQDRPPENPDGGDDPQNNPTRNKPEQGVNPTTGTPDPNGQKVPVGTEPGTQPTRVDSSPAPGAGNLPPVPETSEEAIPADEARLHLLRAVEAIQREKRQYQMKSVKPPARGVKDW